MADSNTPNVVLFAMEVIQMHQDLEHFRNKAARLEAERDQYLDLLEKSSKLNLKSLHDGFVALLQVKYDPARTGNANAEGIREAGNTNA